MTDNDGHFSPRTLDALREAMERLPQPLSPRCTTRPLPFDPDSTVVDQ